MSAQQAYQMRWAIAKDSAGVTAIDASGDSPMDRDAFLALLRTTNVHCMVAENPEGEIVGYMVYKLWHRHIEVLRFAVAPPRRLNGVGRVMLNKMVSKLGVVRKTLRIDVPDTNLGFQVFLRKCGVKCIGIQKGEVSSTYRFEHRVEEPVTAGGSS